MMVLAAATTDPRDRVFQAVSERRAAIRDRVRVRIVEAIREDSLPVDTDVEATVGLVYGFLMGISTLVRDGVPAESLQRSVDALLAGWGPSDATADVVGVGVG